MASFWKTALWSPLWIFQYLDLFQKKFHQKAAFCHVRLVFLWFRGVKLGQNLVPLMPLDAPVKILIFITKLSHKIDQKTLIFGHFWSFSRFLGAEMDQISVLTKI